MYVLRKKGNNAAINVSYSPEGLMWTSNSSGQLIACKNASVKVDMDSKNDTGYTSYTINGDTRLNGQFYIELFKPRTFKATALNTKEKKMSQKARAMSYSSWANGTSVV